MQDMQVGVPGAWATGSIISGSGCQSERGPRGAWWGGHWVIRWAEYALAHGGEAGHRPQGGHSCWTKAYGFSNLWTVQATLISGAKASGTHKSRATHRGRNHSSCRGFPGLQSHWTCWYASVVITGQAPGAAGTCILLLWGPTVSSAALQWDPHTGAPNPSCSNWAAPPAPPLSVLAALVWDASVTAWNHELLRWESWGCPGVATHGLWTNQSRLLSVSPWCWLCVNSCSYNSMKLALLKQSSNIHWALNVVKILTGLVDLWVPGKVSPLILQLLDSIWYH